VKKIFERELLAWIGEDGVEHLDSRGYSDEILMDICAAVHVAVRKGYDAGYEQGGK
jgi:hypothetical protein